MEAHDFVNNPIMSIEDIRTTLFYRGSCNSKNDLPIAASRGDVCAVGDDIYLYVGGGNWILADVVEDKQQDNPPKITARICSQCGAPVKASRLTCEYCGVRYE